MNQSIQFPINSLHRYKRFVLSFASFAKSLLVFLQKKKKENYFVQYRVSFAAYKAQLYRDVETKGNSASGEISPNSKSTID